MTANERIIAIIAQLGIKQIDILEKEPNLKQNTLSSNLKEADWPNGLLAAALSKHWGVNLNWVYTGEGKPLQSQAGEVAVLEYLQNQIHQFSTLSDSSN